MNLAAARELAVKCSASSICLSKTPAILRQELDFAGLDADLEEDNLNDTLETTLLKRHMAAEARSYRDLEGLLEALDYIEGTAGIIDALDEP
jgi:nuclear pore complex protein Nup107